MSKPIKVNLQLFATKNKYYSLEVNGKEADIYIFGDIVEDWEKELWGFESDVSGLSLVNEVKDLDVDVINVHINSYGGIVSEGLAIYNTLKNHKAKVRTIVDGFACSAASVVFMAGEERYMNDASLLMIHNAWTRVTGNAAELRKYADDLDKITQGSIEAYKARATISEEKIKELMDAETWVLPVEALEWGFATGIIKASETNKAAASARKALFNMVKNMVQVPASPVSSKEPEPEPASNPEPEPTSGSDFESKPKENKPVKFMAALFR